MSRSPVVILYDASGNALAVQDGVAIPASTRGLLAAGSDGTNAKFLKVGADGALVTTMQSRQTSVVSTGNSTATPLGVDGAFTGAWEELLGYAFVGVVLRSDQASAAAGLVFEFSSDGTNVDDSDTYSVSANNGKFITLPIEARYFRVRYTNGSVAQTFFRLQTIYHPFGIKPSSHNLSDALSDENDAELVKAIISGRKPDGMYTNAEFSSAGNLLVETGQPALSGLVDTFLLNGSAQNMIVNGSVTPQTFKYEPPVDYDVELKSMSFVAEAGTVDFGASKFISVNSALTNGCLVEIKAEDVVYTIVVMKTTKDFAHFSAGGSFYVAVSGTDILVAQRAFPAGLKLKKSGTYGSPDYVKVVIRDNLTATAAPVSFEARLSAVQA